MVEVTLQMSEDELKRMIIEEFNSIGDYDPYDAELYRSYFSNIIDDGSATLLFGPTNIRDWVLATLDRTTIITRNDDEYTEIEKLWEEKEYMNNQYQVMGKGTNGDFLIEYF